MVLLYTSITLALATVFIPAVLATVSRERGWRIVDQAWQLVTTVPRLLADGVARWEERILSRSRSALQETKVRTWGQVAAVIASVLVALAGMLALFINFASTLAGLQGTREFVIEVLAGMNVTPITLMSVEMYLACFYCPALLLDAFGVTHIFYTFLRISSLSWPKWRRTAARVLLGLLALAGTIGAGYILHENGVLRENVVEKSSSKSLLESSGLSSGENSSGQTSSGQTSPGQVASSTPESTAGEDREWAAYVSTTWPSPLGYLAGIFAFANSIPALALLIRGIYALLWLFLRPIRAVARAVVELLRQVHFLMLSLFNLTLDFRGKPPVDLGKDLVRRSDNSGLQADPGEQIGPKTKINPEGQIGNDNSEKRGPSNDDPKSDDDSRRGGRDEPPSSGNTDTMETGSDDTGRNGANRGSTDSDTSSTSPPNKGPLTGRVFQPWWFKNPPSQRPSNPDDAEKEPGQFYSTFEQAVKASRAREPARRACVLKLQLEESGRIDFLNRYDPPTGESGKDI